MTDSAFSATAPARDQASGAAALLVIDMINRFDFPGGERLRAKAGAIVAPILALRRQFARGRSPVIFVNDNFGEWHSERSRLVEGARRHAPEIVSPLEPDEGDFFVIKPQFSGFYASNLSVLLPKLGVSRLVVTGIAADICVLFTAADAHMRDYALWVPEDAVTAESESRAGWALEIMRDHLGAETASTGSLDLPSWAARLDQAGHR